MDALHPKRDLPEQEQKSPALADEQKQSTPTAECRQTTSSASEDKQHAHQKVKLRDVNSSLTCDLCKGYLIDATTISECLHSFCRSCIIKFLEENSFCPVCEVIINKAKPNLKLDKTLQDIVYKLVPGLFLSEMMRRRRFYADKPAEAGRVSPEQRGEDTERTIFNPQDRISLSLEYIGDAATTGLILKDLKQKEEDVQTESLLKRYLQCPAMCRIDVIKKFIRNKYNVNTDLFQIDILYKRVPLPLPDHYTLVDVAYIYTWKRNEPMRFYFRIIDKGNEELPDLTKVFTPVDDAPLLPQPLALSTPNRASKGLPVAGLKEKNRKTPKRGVAKKLPVAKPTKKEKKDEAICDKGSEEEDKGRKRLLSDPEDPPAKTSTPEATQVKKETEVAPDQCDNAKVYTNITLNRANNVEIVTKIQKLSDKDGQQIEVNIIDQNARQKSDGSAEPKVEVKTETTEHVVKEEPATETPKEEPSTDAEPKTEPSSSPTPEVSSTTNDLPLEDEEMEKTKFEFLKSIELTAKKVVDNIARLVHQQQQNTKNQATSSTSQQLKLDVAKLKKPTLATKPGTNGLKRKNPSPLKNDPKKPKVEPKRTTKIILQQKPGYPPLNLSKPPEKPSLPEDLIKQNRNELRSLFQTCRLNIPSSLSITLKENGETSRQPVQMPPVQNFIEILKIDEKAGTQTVTLKREEVKNPDATAGQFPKTLLRQMEQARKKGKEPSEKTKEQQSFQKIFEESIKKVGSELNPSNVDASGCIGKKKILDIAQQLYKRTRIEMDAKKNVQAKPISIPSPLVPAPSLQKVPIPRLNNQRVVKPPKRSQKYENSTHQTLTNLHSSSLGLNYTVSVGKQPREVMAQTSSSFRAEQVKTNAVPGGVFVSQPSPVSSIPEAKSPQLPKALLSPKTTPSPKPEQKCLPPPQSSPKFFSSKSKSPRPSSGNPSPKPRSSNPSPKPPVSPSAHTSSSPSGINSNELVDKYNMQNLAQLSASMNFEAQAYLNSMSSKQVTALHQAMLMKQLELHNRQSWFNINQAPLLQYEKYLQNLNASKNQLMGNLKDN